MHYISPIFLANTYFLFIREFLYLKKWIYFLFNKLDLFANSYSKQFIVIFGCVFKLYKLRLYVKLILTTVYLLSHIEIMIMSQTK